MSLVRKLEKVWVSVYDNQLTDEQIKRLSFMHNSLDEGSRPTQWFERVKICRSWAYALAKRDNEEPTPNSTKEWRQSCQNLYTVHGKVSLTAGS